MEAVDSAAPEMEEVELAAAVAAREAAEEAPGSAEAMVVAAAAAGLVEAMAAAAVEVGSAAARVVAVDSAATVAWGLDTKSTRSTRSCFQRNCMFEEMRKRSCKSVLMLGCSSRIPDQQRKTTTLYSAGSAGSAAGSAGLAGSVVGSAALEDWAADWATAEAGEGLAAAAAQGTEAKSSP